MELDPQNANRFSPTTSEEETEEVREVQTKIQMYKQVEVIHLEDCHEGNCGEPFTYWESWEPLPEGPQNEDEADPEAEEDAEDEDEARNEVAEEVDGNVSILSNLTPSADDLELIQTVQQDLVQEMTDVRRIFYSLMRRVEKMKPDIDRLQRLVEGAGRIPEPNQ